jgi:hypothetical protein
VPTLGELDAVTRAYLAAVVARAGALLGVRLLGAYAGGSIALGGYEPVRSDIDLAMVVEARLDPALKEALVEALRHEALPCPARGLELVIYERSAAASPAIKADFELNLNTGPRMPFRVDPSPDVDDPHWFAIDRSILRAHGMVLTGPPAAEVFGIVLRERLLPVVADAVRWHLDGAAAPADAVLNACRALRYATEGRWTSKADAARWALGRVPDPTVILAALAARAGGPGPGSNDAGRFVRSSIDTLDRVDG